MKRLAPVLLFVLLPACVTPIKTHQPSIRLSLYERLGGAPAVTALVDDFVTRALANPGLNFARLGTSRAWQPTTENVAYLKRSLVQLVTVATGGPGRNDGRSMAAAHRGMSITPAEFDALMADFQATLHRFEVPESDRRHLSTIMESTRRDIVTADTAAASR